MANFSDFNQDCLLFNGFKPCQPYKVCKDCDSPKIRINKTLYIHTGGLGDIVRCLGILKILSQRGKEGSEFFVVTSPKGKELFKEKIPNLVIFSLDEFKTLVHVLEFDFLYNLDRDIESSALAVLAKAKEKKGFSLNVNGKLSVFNYEALEIFELGLNDQKKFFENKVPAHQLMAKAMGVVRESCDFPYLYDYTLPGSIVKRQDNFIKDLRKDFSFLVGINLGVGPAIPPKGLSEPHKTKTIEFLLSQNQNIGVLLLGGEEERNEAKALSSQFEGKRRGQVSFFISSDINEGAMAIKSLDLLITSDTFALHLGVGLGIKVCSWFGPTHPEEIVRTPNLKFVRSSRDCSPCWKKKCPKETPCNEDQEIFLGIIEIVKHYLT